MPKIIEITIGLATSFNNPFESYSNFKPSVQLKATVAEGEYVAGAVAELQAMAGSLLSQERRRILDGLKREHDIESAEREVQYAEGHVKSYQEIIDESPARLAGAADYEVESIENRVKHANEEIAGAKNSLAEAKQKLADLIGM